MRCFHGTNHSRQHSLRHNCFQTIFFCIFHTTSFTDKWIGIFTRKKGAGPFCLESATTVIADASRPGFTHSLTHDFLITCRHIYNHFIADVMCDICQRFHLFQFQCLRQHVIYTVFCDIQIGMRTVQIYIVANQFQQRTTCCRITVNLFHRAKNQRMMGQQHVDPCFHRSIDRILTRR